MRRSASLIIALMLSACASRTGHLSPAAATTANQLVIGEDTFSASDIVSATVGFSPIGQPLVNVRLSPAAAVRFAELTRANVGNELPIRVGGKILSNPRVLEPITGGAVQISGLMSIREAQLLARQITGR
jgi:preprotein translocase subunit SecD